MISIRNIILRLDEVSPAVADRETQRAKDAGGEKFNPSPADLAKRNQMGVPPDAISAGFGRWVNKQNLYIGKTIDGKFVPATPDELKKAQQRGGRSALPGDQSRTQSSRDDREKATAAATSRQTPKQRMRAAAGDAADRISAKTGYNPKTRGRSEALMDLEVKINDRKLPRTKNPDLAASADDKEVSFMPLDDYIATNAPKASRREIEALSKFNTKFPDANNRTGMPLSIQPGSDGRDYIALRVR
jgi:hypothetical protein